jgi:hypothetical protein
MKQEKLQNVRLESIKAETPELQFQSRNLFREWLCKNYDTSGGIWIVFDKTKPSKTLSANDALEEALCFGWIDGRMKSIDDTKYMKYFARCRPNSPWSDKNKKLVAALCDKGLMTDAGEGAVKNQKGRQMKFCGGLFVVEEKKRSAPHSARRTNSVRSITGNALKYIAIAAMALFTNGRFIGFTPSIFWY